MKRHDQLKTSNGQSPLNGQKIGTVGAESPMDTATSIIHQQPMTLDHAPYLRDRQ